MNQQTYRMHDQKPSGMVRCSEAEAREWNPKGWGIFITVNDFAGERRIQNLRRINAYAVDIDTGTKEEMALRIRTGLTPSLVVETKRGYHCWWLVEDAEPQYWNAVVLDRLVPFYGADKNARDLCRVLRMPGFMHMKDPQNPFPIQTVFEWKVRYRQAQFAQFYPDRSEPQRKEFIERQSRENPTYGPFWEKVWRIDCIAALETLSGTEYVNGEEYSFRRNSNGKFNLLVNGKATSCFVDEELRIGSLSGGGPTIFQWLRWYGHAPRRCVEIMQELFPFLEAGQ